MNTMPYWRWFPGEAMNDLEYRSLTLEELGFFHLCLNYSWLNDGIPSDLEKLRKSLALDSRKFKRLWGKVGQTFREVDGTFRQLRQEVERTYVRSRSVKATESVNRRYDGSTRQTSDVRHQTQDVILQTPEKHYVNSETVRQTRPTKTKTPSSKENKSKGDEDFDQGIEESRESVGEDRFRHIFLMNLHEDHKDGRISHEELEQSIKNYADYQEAQKQAI